VGWRCGGCGGRMNREVLEEQEELARKMEEEGGEGKEEEKVPEELKLGYREDIERQDVKSADTTGGGGGIDAGDSDGAPALTDEGSLSPKALSTQAQPTSQHPEPPTSPDQPLPPAPQPQAATIPASITAPVTPAQTQPPIIQRQTTQQQLAPAPTANSWIDLAIVGIAVMLGAMVLRKLLLLNE
jgi:ubiquitin-conjugating enzyme E2 J1